MEYLKDLKIENISINEITEYENNAKEHPEWHIEQIANSIQAFGFNDPIALNEDNQIIEGHGRYLAAKKLGMNEIPCIVLKGLTEQEERAYIIAHNKITMNTDFDFDKLQYELNALKIEDFDISLTGVSDIEINDIFNDEKTLIDKIKENPIDSNLFDSFVIPPFSVFDTRTGYWQDRKKCWLDLGIKSEVGRDENLTFSKNLQSNGLKGTSIFDPVLCEVSYLWFSPNDKNSKILDPFAGGSVRGIVAEKLGFNYTGIDLRKEQIEANIDNAKEVNCDINKINWINDDSQNIDKYIEDNSIDLIFTCPPYFDLEVYSDNERDISNMNYTDFSKVYKNILHKCCDKLKNNRFAIVVISDVRDNRGLYRDLTGLTKEAFKEKGINFYNDIILLNVCGSGALRARKTMKNRKVVRTHQNVLVFFKGDPKNIQDDFIELKNVDYNFENNEDYEEIDG